MSDLRSIFDTGDVSRARFLSRVFGIFSEDIVKSWACDPKAPYEDLGRPTVLVPGPDGKPTRHTLDFTLRERGSLKTFVAEMKCEIEYQRFRYCVLENESQLDHHKKPAFQAFLDAAKCSKDLIVEVNIKGKRKRIDVGGAILIWGAATLEGKERVKQIKGIYEVLTIEEICQELRLWKKANNSSRWSNSVSSGAMNCSRVCWTKSPD